MILHYIIFLIIVPMIKSVLIIFLLSAFVKVSFLNDPCFLSNATSVISQSIYKIEINPVKEFIFKLLDSIQDQFVDDNIPDPSETSKESELFEDVEIISNSALASFSLFEKVNSNFLLINSSEYTGQISLPPELL